MMNNIEQPQIDFSCAIFGLVLTVMVFLAALAAMA